MKNIVIHDHLRRKILSNQSPICYCDITTVSKSDRIIIAIHLRPKSTESNNIHTRFHAITTKHSLVTKSPPVDVKTCGVSKRGAYQNVQRIKINNDEFNA